MRIKEEEHSQRSRASTDESREETSSAPVSAGRAAAAIRRKKGMGPQTAQAKYGLTDKKDNPLDVRFKHLGLVHKHSGKAILSNLTGRFLAGELGAVIGPSGCGKSSFLSVLAGIAHWGYQTGTTFVNNVPDTLVKHRGRCGFVPQDDVVFPTLTVRENLIYQALLRMPVLVPQKAARQGGEEDRPRWKRRGGEGDEPKPKREVPVPNRARANELVGHIMAMNRKKHKNAHGGARPSPTPALVLCLPAFFSTSAGHLSRRAASRSAGCRAHATRRKHVGGLPPCDMHMHMT